MSEENFLNTLTDAIQSLAKNNYSQMMVKTAFSMIFLVPKEKAEEMVEQILEAANLKLDEWSFNKRITKVFVEMIKEES